MADIFKEQFDKARSTYFEHDQVKKLRLSDTVDADGLVSFAEHFKGASGKMYKVKTIDQGITIDRWNAYEKLSVMFQYDASLQQLMDNNQKSIDICDSIFLGDGKYSSKHLVQHLMSIGDGFKSNTESKYSKALLFCSIFIIREDEDERSWDLSIAHEKIEDWAKTGIDVMDFFLLARSFSLAWVKQFKSEHHG